MSAPATPTMHRWGSGSALAFGVLAVSLAALRQRLLAPWLARSGVGLAALLSFSSAGFPLALLIIWIVAVGHAGPAAAGRRDRGDLRLIRRPSSAPTTRQQPKQRLAGATL